MKQKYGHTKRDCHICDGRDVYSIASILFRLLFDHSQIGITECRTDESYGFPITEMIANAVNDCFSARTARLQSSFLLHAVLFVIMCDVDVKMCAMAENT